MEGSIFSAPGFRAGMLTWLFVALLFVPVISTAQTLSENTQMSFGTTVKPASGSGTLILGLNDSVSGTAQSIGGTIATGDYTIGRGTIGSTALIDINATDTTSRNGISLSSFTATYGGNAITLPATSQPNPGASGTILRLGSTLTITSAVSPGVNINPTFDITVTKSP